MKITDLLDGPTPLAPLLWAGFAALAVLVLVGLLATLYFYYRSRLAALRGDAFDAAELSQWLADMEAKRDAFEQWKAASEEELLRLKSEREEQESIRTVILALESQRVDEQDRLDEQRKETVELQEAVSRLAADRDSLSDQVGSLTTEAETFHARSEDLKVKAKEIEAEFEKAQKELVKVRSSADEKRSELDAMERRLLELEREIRSTEGHAAEAERIKTELETARKKLAEETIDVEGLVQQRREKADLKLDIDALSRQQGDLKSENAELQGVIDEGVQKSRYADLAEVEPLSLQGLDGGPSEVTEVQALDNFSNHLKDRGLVFHPRVQRAFHTCLKTNDISPITVLAGVSGTGKSELPLRYAEALGIHNLLVAVQPGWSTPQDLFGFYNYLERRYKATELARVLVRMDPYNFTSEEGAFAQIANTKKDDRMFLVLVDEMNIARVEYYFSEFLSKLETRRQVDRQNPERRHQAEIEIEGAQESSGRTSGRAMRFFVDNNVLFSGTMNEDESTQALSDKVLDRANVLRFGRPVTKTHQVHHERASRMVSDQWLPFGIWKEWLREPDDQDPWRRDVEGAFEELNDALERIGRPFGWRIRRAMLSYVANYPNSNAGDTWKLALADQIEQKVLPKIRGIDLSVQANSRTLNDVQNVIDKTGDEELVEAVRAASRGDSELGSVFQWTGVSRGEDV